VSRMGFVQDGATDGTFLDAGPVPVGSQLPAVYRDYDPHMMRFTTALDAVLAPCWLSIECFDAYLDPSMSPTDFVEWLAHWIGVVVDDNWRPDQLRRLISRAAELYKWRGTRDGIADLVEAYTGLKPDVTDSGGTTISTTAGSIAPGSGTPAVQVRIEGSTLSEDEHERLERLLRSSVPAHVAILLDVSSTSRRSTKSK
jgi:phage tail-like protein